MAKYQLYAFKTKLPFSLYNLWHLRATTVVEIVSGAVEGN